eukprot:s3797_g5.t1
MVLLKRAGQPPDARQEELAAFGKLKQKMPPDIPGILQPIAASLIERRLFHPSSVPKCAFGATENLYPTIRSVPCPPPAVKSPDVTGAAMNRPSPRKEKTLLRELTEVRTRPAVVPGLLCNACPEAFQPEEEQQQQQLL